MGIRLGIIVLGDGCAGQGLIVDSGSREMNMSLLFSLVKIVQSSNISSRFFCAEPVTLLDTCRGSWLNFGRSPFAPSPLRFFAWGFVTWISHIGLD
jgi:hypothetical protein